MIDFIRSSDSAILLRSSTTSGTTRLAASVGVDALRSDTSSMIGLSFSWPIAEMTGVSQAATALTSASSLKPTRSRKPPPPRVMIITSTSGSSSIFFSAAITLGAHSTP